MCALIKLLFTEREEPSRRGSRLSISLFLHLWSRLPYMQRGEKLLCCYLHRRYLHSDFEKVHSADENSLFFHLFAFSFFALCDFSPISLSFFLLVCFTFPPPAGGTERSGGVEREVLSSRLTRAAWPCELYFIISVVRWMRAQLLLLLSLQWVEILCRTSNTRKLNDVYLFR